MQRWPATGFMRRALMSLFCCSLLMAWQGYAQKTCAADNYKLAVVTSDSESYPIGVALSSLVKLQLLPSQNIDLEIIGTEGYSESLELLLDDQVHFALMQGTSDGDLPAGLDNSGSLQAIASLSSFDDGDPEIRSRSESPTEESHFLEEGHFLAARSDVDEDIVYRITKTIFDHLDLLGKIDQRAKRITLQHAPMGLPVSIHKGALRFYEEREVPMPALTEFAVRSPLQRYDVPEEAREEINDQTVGILADERSGGGSKLISELAGILKDEDDLRLISMTNRDSLNHLGDLIYREGIDLAIIQADLLAHAREELIYPSLDSEVSHIATLFDAEIHLLVKDSVKTIEDLRGQHVSFGFSGSTTSLTAANIFEALKIPVVQKSFELDEAIVQLKAGALSGVVVVGAKPLPELAAIGADDGMTLLSLAVEETAGLYQPATIEANTYPGLIAPGQTVDTMAVPTVLTTYNWQVGGERYSVVERFVLALFSRIHELRERGRHPTWQAINLLDELPGWKRWPPAKNWVQQFADGSHPLRKAIDDDRAANDHGTINSKQANNKIKRHEEALLVD